jgi:ubiquitin-protein ligase E3 C
VTDTTPIPGHTAKNTTRDLKLGGSNIPVTNQNRLVYISYIARHRLQVQPYYQTNAFLQGLGQIIQPSWLSMFNQNELQTLIGGDASDIDIADLRRNTLYGGVYVIGDDKLEHPTIKFFWEVLEGMTNEERQKVLKFVTSTPRAPLLGFSHLNPRFSIRDSSDDQDRLPSTSTCVNLLKLPRYTNARTLREKLLYAINSGAGFDLS